MPTRSCSGSTSVPFRSSRSRRRGRSRRVSCSPSRLPVFWTQELTSDLLQSQHRDSQARTCALREGDAGLRHPHVDRLRRHGVSRRRGLCSATLAGWAVSLNAPEPAMGALILTPAVLEAYRYVRPESRWAKWAARIAAAGVSRPRRQRPTLEAVSITALAGADPRVRPGADTWVGPYIEGYVGGTLFASCLSHVQPPARRSRRDGRVIGRLLAHAAANHRPGSAESDLRTVQSDPAGVCRSDSAAPKASGPSGRKRAGQGGSGDRRRRVRARASDVAGRRPAHHGAARRQTRRRVHRPDGDRDQSRHHHAVQLAAARSDAGRAGRTEYDAGGDAHTRDQPAARRTARAAQAHGDPAAAPQAARVRLRRPHADPPRRRRRRRRRLPAGGVARAGAGGRADDLTCAARRGEDVAAPDAVDPRRGRSWRSSATAAPATSRSRRSRKRCSPTSTRPSTFRSC